MIDLSTDYLGLKLKNPLVPSSSPLSKSLDSVLRLEDAGAAAVVLHSLYEEELIAEDAMAERFLLHADLNDGEATGFMPDHGNYESSIDRYLEHLRLVKTRLSIPVIASLNGVTPVRLDRSGQGDAELPAPMRSNSTSITWRPTRRERRRCGGPLRGPADRAASGWWRIPVVMKLPPFFSSLTAFRKTSRSRRGRRRVAVQPFLPARHRPRKP
jgi:dihydroorotate dehydrogenase (fumarate)